MVRRCGEFGVVVIGERKKECTRLGEKKDEMKRKKNV